MEYCKKEELNRYMREEKNIYNPAVNNLINIVYSNSLLD